MKTRSLSITTILIAVLATFSTLTLLLLGVIINKYTEASLKETSVSYSNQLINQIQYNLDNFYTDIDNTLYNFVTSGNLVDILKGYKQNDDYTRLQNRKTVSQMISSLTKSHDEMGSIFVLNQDTYITLTSIQFESNEFIQQIREDYPDYEYIKPYYYPVDYAYYYNQAKYKKEMFAAIPVRDYLGHDKTNYGVVLASIRTDKLDNLFAPLRQDGFDVYILDAASNIYYSSDLTSLDKPYTFDKKNLLEVSLPLSKKDWQVVITSDMSDAMERIEKMHRTIVTGTVISILLVVLVLMYFSTKITYPLKYMAQQMETMDYDKLSRQLDSSKSYKEIEQLYSGYNKMLKRIENLIDTVSYERLRQKEAHFEALQSKINPHFLYNTLQSIYSLAILDRATDVEIVTIALSDMLEYITYEKTEQVLFSKELEYINNYLEIQKRRYNNKFTVEYHVDNAAKFCLLNKLLIQPIIENAINHGFSQLLENGLLIISAYVSADNLIIEIVDNGIGMNHETLECLMQRLDNPLIANKDKSIGLSNIKERIHLKYGKDYGLTILSETDAGTRVIVKIPAQYQEEEYHER